MSFQTRLSVPWYIPLCNYFLPVYLVLGVVLCTNFITTTAATWAFALFWLYGLPPLLARATLVLWGLPEGRYVVNHPVYARWWLLTQIQILYNRAPLLEEMLRCVPGLYSMWLNLWGAQVSIFAYWSPGVVVADRYLLRIGKGAVLGGGCRIGGHVVERQTDGHWWLTLGPLTIDPGAMIGLQAAAGPGCRVFPKETLPAGTLLRPYYSWRNHRRWRPDGTTD